jgi:hypothetical protein
MLTQGKDKRELILFLSDEIMRLMNLKVMKRKNGIR